ncbi:hypothetical protein T484DRAFT_1882840, partial [Baffinella frigidus]
GDPERDQAGGGHRARGCPRVRTRAAHGGYRARCPRQQVPHPPRNVPALSGLSTSDFGIE